MVKYYIYAASSLLLGCTINTLSATKSLSLLARENNKKALLQILESSGCAQNEKNIALLTAAKCPVPPEGSEKDRLIIISMLLTYGAKIEYSSTKKETGLAGGSPLFFATEESYIQRVALLLQHGADPNWTDHRGYTPLIRACINGNTKIARLLCQHGADIHAQSKTGSRALSFCAMRKHLELTNELLQRGALVSTDEKINNYAKKFIEKTSRTATKKRLSCLKTILHSSDRFYDDLMRLFLTFDGSGHLWDSYKKIP